MPVHVSRADSFPLRSAAGIRRRCSLRSVSWFAWVLWLSLACPAWAQEAEGEDSLPAKLQAWVETMQDYFRTRSPRALIGAGALVVGVCILFWIVRRLRRGPGGLASDPGRLKMEAQRLLRTGATLDAALRFQQAGDLGAAADAYERGRSYVKAARLYEQARQAGHAARLYEQAGEFFSAAELCVRMGNHLKASSLFERGGNDVRAAESAERGGDLERAVSLYVKSGAFDRAGEIRFHLEQFEEAAALTERALGRLRASGGLAVSQPVQALARRCAEAYLRIDDHAKAGVVLRDAGLEIEAAEQFCRGGEWNLGIGLYVRHREFEQAARLCQSLGRATELQLILAEQHLDAERFADAGRAFEAAGVWARAAESYQHAAAYAKAADMYARCGDHDHAAEMYVAAGAPAKAAQALVRLGKRNEAARLYREAGDSRQAATLLQEAGDPFGAATALIEAKAEDEAIGLLQQIGTDSPHYLEATVLLGDLFFQNELDGPAREKYEKAASLRPISAEFIHPTYQLARVYERQGNLQEALHLYERVVAEQVDFRDVQQRITDVTELLAALPQGKGSAEGSSGRVTPSRYRILKELGRGGMGIVYKAEDTTLQRVVAYKVLPDTVRDDPKALSAFLREARIAASLRHPNIVTIFDAGQVGDTLYIAMEFVDGRALHQILDEVGILPLPKALDILRQACRSLIHAHQQDIVHRDVKPANIMVSHSGEVKLMDFGLAAIVTTASAQVTTVRGTPYYMAPEQILGEPLSGLTDQYALGCTLFHMLTGRPPFTEGDVLYHHIHSRSVSPQSLNPKVPAWLDALILRMMVKSPEKRFPSLEIVLQEVERRVGPKLAAADDQNAG